MSEWAWAVLGEGQHWHVITQLRLQGAVDLCASLIQQLPDGTQYISASGTLESPHVHQIGPRLSLLQLIALTKVVMPGVDSILTRIYNDPPVEVGILTDEN